MDIILIRHAQPGYTDGHGVSRSNPPLTELGYQQADTLPSVAASWSAPTLLVSPMVRARETMAPIEAALGDTAAVHDWMHEIGAPSDWEGSPAHEIDDVFHQAQRRDPDEWWDGFPGGESFRDFHDRVWKGFEGTLSDFGVRVSSHHHQLWEIADPDICLVFVAHGGTNGLLLARLLGAEPVPWEWERFFISHASVSTLTSTTIGPDHIFSLRSFADTSHITGMAITA